VVTLEETVVPGLKKLKREKVQRILSKFLKEKKAWKAAFCHISTNEDVSSSVE